MKKLLSQGEFDESELMNLIDKRSQLKSDLKKGKVKMMLSMRNILDEEQKKIFTKHFHKIGMREKRDNGRNKRRFMGEDGRPDVNRKRYNYGRHQF